MKKREPLSDYSLLIQLSIRYKLLYAADLFNSANKNDYDIPMDSFVEDLLRENHIEESQIMSEITEIIHGLKSEVRDSHEKDHDDRDHIVFIKDLNKLIEFKTELLKVRGDPKYETIKDISVSKSIRITLKNRIFNFTSWRLFEYLIPYLIEYEQDPLNRQILKLSGSDSTSEEYLSHFQSPKRAANLDRYVNTDIRNRVLHFLVDYLKDRNIIHIEPGLKSGLGTDHLLFCGRILSYLKLVESQEERNISDDPSQYLDEKSYSTYKRYLVQTMKSILNK